MLVHQQQAFEFNNSMVTTNKVIERPQRRKQKTMQENVEQIVFELSNSINSQLANISAILTAQITDLAAKIDGHKQKTISVELQIRDAIIPAIQELAKVIDYLAQQTTSSSCSEMVKCFFEDPQYSSFNAPRSKKQSQKNNATQIQNKHY